MSNINALTFRQKNTTLKNIFKQYKRAKVKLDILKQTSYYPQIQYGVVKDSPKSYRKSMLDKLNTKIDNETELENLIQSFDTILEMLSEESRRMIEYEYINDHSSNWWYEFYSKSTYYRVKTKAMEEILFYLSI